MKLINPEFARRVTRFARAMQAEGAPPYKKDGNHYIVSPHAVFNTLSNTDPEFSKTMVADIGADPAQHLYWAIPHVGAPLGSIDHVLDGDVQKEIDHVARRLSRGDTNPDAHLEVPDADIWRHIVDHLPALAAFFEEHYPGEPVDAVRQARERFN